MAYARQKSPRRGRRNRLLARGSRSRNSSKLRITYDYSDDLNASYRISSHRGNHRIRRYISPPSIPSSKGGKPRADRWHPRWPLVKLLENSDRADGTATERRQGMEKGDMPLSLSLSLWTSMENGISMRATIRPHLALIPRLIAA